MNKYEQYLRVFKDFDENGDGKLSPRELQQRMECTGGGLVSMEDVEAAVACIDSDGDGYLCMEDLVRLVEEAGDEEKKNDLREAFKMYEAEGSGYIDPKSLNRMLRKLGQSKTLSQCKQMIASFDLNGDGVLCFDEFKTMMAS